MSTLTETRPPIVATAETAPAGPRVRSAVAVIVSRFPKLTETFILREIDALERAGVPVTLVPLIRHREETVHPQAEPWMDRALWSGWLSAAVLRGCLASLRRAPGASLAAALRVLAGSASSPSLLWRNLVLLPKGLYLAEELRRRGLRHVHAHFATHPTTVAWIVRRVAGIDYSFTAHAHDIFVDTRLLDTKIRDAALVRAISAHNARVLRDLAPEVPADRIRVLRLGVPADADPSAPRPAGSAARRILAVAALRPYKGLDVLVDACHALRRRGVELECEIVGDGPLRSRLEARISALGVGDRVRLLGAMTQEQVRQRMRRADVLVHPGVIAADGQMDGIPVALMEAMSLGLPVVASALSGIPELVRDGDNGLLVAPGDSDELAAALGELLARPDLRQRLGRNALATVSRDFDLETNTERLAEALDEVTPATGIDPATVTELLRRAGLPAPDRLGVERIREGADAVLTEITAVHGGAVRRLVLKRHRERPGAERPAVERARHEQEVLARLDAALASGTGLRVPTPLARRQETLLLTRCAGRSLEAILRNGRWSLAQAGRLEAYAAVERAGAWLAAMHGATQAPGSDGDALATLHAEVVADLETIAAAGRRRIPVRRLRAVAGRLARQARTGGAAGAPGPTLRHGDFWPGNVLVDDTSISVLDLEGARAGLGAYDVAYFLLHLETYHRWPGLRRRGRRLARRFLRGYGREAPLALLRLARMAVAARLIVVDLARDEAGSSDRGRRLRRTLRRAGEWTP